MASRRTTPLKDYSLGTHHCSVEVRMEKLAMVPFFANLSEKELKKVNRKFSAHHFSAGEPIYYQNEKITRLRVVVHGAVQLVRHTLEGKDILLDMLQPGEYFGNPSAERRQTHEETAAAHTDACILSISMIDFRSLLENYSEVALSVLDITADRLRKSREHIRHLTTLPVKKRVAHILKMLCDKFGEGSRNGRLIQIPLTRKNLADMTGTSTETVSRAISDFQQQDIVETGRRWIAITDSRKLSEIADG